VQRGMKLENTIASSALSVFQHEKCRAEMKTLIRKMAGTSTHSGERNEGKKIKGIVFLIPTIKKGF